MSTGAILDIWAAYLSASAPGRKQAVQPTTQFCSYTSTVPPFRTDEGGLHASSQDALPRQSESNELRAEAEQQRQQRSRLPQQPQLAGDELWETAGNELLPHQQQQQHESHQVADPQHHRHRTAAAAAAAAAATSAAQNLARHPHRLRGTTRSSAATPGTTPYIRLTSRSTRRRRRLTCS